MRTTKKPIAMNSRPEQADGGTHTPFFMLFPWGRVAGGLLVLYLVCMGVYRISDVGGEQAAQACFAALLVALVSAAASVYPMAKFWGHNAWRMLVGIFLGILIRLLLIGGGVVIITVFTDINQIYFVLFLKLYYLFFLICDMWLAVWLVRHSRGSAKKGSAYGNVWDIVEQF